MTEISRRKALALGSGMVALAILPMPANASIEQVMEDIKTFTGGAEATESSIIKLEVPEIAENGNTVPLSVSVESPMTADNYVKRVILLAEKNPNPGIATFHFSSRSGVAEASTRMRLATTQNVVAVAELSDGSFHMTKSTVKVTIGGCGG